MSIQVDSSHLLCTGEKYALFKEYQSQLVLDKLYGHHLLSHLMNIWYSLGGFLRRLESSASNTAIIDHVLCMLPQHHSLNQKLAIPGRPFCMKDKM